MERTRIVRAADSVKDFEENMLKHHSFDGEAMTQDMKHLLAYERAKHWQRQSATIWIGMTAMSAYNMSRFGVLSKSGKVGAVMGLCVGSFMTFGSFSV